MSRKKLKIHLCKLCSEEIGSDSFICTYCKSTFHKLCLLPSRENSDNWAEIMCPFYARYVSHNAV